MRSFKIKNARLVYLTLLQMISATVKGNYDQWGGVVYPSVPAPPTQPAPAPSTYNQPISSFNKKLRRAYQVLSNQGRTLL